MTGCRGLHAREKPVGMVADLVLVQKAHKSYALPIQSFRLSKKIQAFSVLQAEGWLRVRVVTCTILGG